MGEQITVMLRSGCSYAEIVAALNCSRATVSYHAKKLGMGKSRRVYDWRAVQAYHDTVHSRLECLRRFAFSADAWDKAVSHGELASARVAHSPRLSACFGTRGDTARASQATAAAGRAFVGLLRRVRPDGVAGKTALSASSSQERRRTG